MIVIWTASSLALLDSMGLDASTQRVSALDQCNRTSVACVALQSLGPYLLVLQLNHEFLSTAFARLYHPHKARATLASPVTRPVRQLFHELTTAYVFTTPHPHGGCKARGCLRIFPNASIIRQR